MDTKLYVTLSLMMFFEFAIWGAWCPVLAARLLGPLKMNGKQAGWIYATLPLASMVTPLVAGWLADQYVDARYLLAVCHLIGAVLLIVASKRDTFVGLFAAMFGFSLCYAATLPLVNAVMFSHLTDESGFSAPLVFIWAPVSWALAGYLLTGIRNLRKQEGDGSDCLVLAGVLSVVMFVVCLLQPGTPPPSTSEGIPMLQALRMLSDPSFAVFMLVTLVVAGMQQFYFLGTAPFMQDMNISSKNVPAVMAIAQVTQALATLFLLGGFFYGAVPGPVWTMVLGAACWAVLFFIYTRSRSPIAIVPAQAMHGLAYVFFIIAGQMYTNEVADEAIRGSAQGMIFFVQAGLSLFLCTQLAGFIMDRNSVDGQFRWSKIFAVPLACTLLGAIVLAVGVSSPSAEAEPDLEGPVIEVTLPTETAE